MIKNPVVSIEGTKEGHLELSIIAAFDNLGSAFGDLFFSRDTALTAGIEDANTSILS
jgi:hypothetical protein